MADNLIIRRVLSVVALALALLVAWRLHGVVLLLFGSVVFAILFDAVAGALSRRVRLNRSAALAVTVCGVALVVCGAIGVFGLRLEAQVADLLRRLPYAWANFSLTLDKSPLGATIVNAVDQMTSRPAAELFSTARAYLFTAGVALLGLLLMLVAAVYLAAQPELYRDGLLRLAPARARGDLERFLARSGHMIRRWLLAETAAMLIVGLLTGMGLWVIGVPAPGALGLIAALGEFVPMIGVLIAAAPALLLAATQGWPTVGWTLLLLTAIHQFDGNVAQPLLQRGFNSLPPVVTLFALVVFGDLFGFIGLVLAVPLALVCVAALETWLATPGDQTAG